MALGVMAGLFLLPIIGYHTIPSFKAKGNYMRWDWKMYQEGTGAEYADSGRLTSLKVGYDIFKANPWFGTHFAHGDTATNTLELQGHPEFIFAAILVIKMQQVCTTDEHTQWPSVAFHVKWNQSKA